MDGQTAFWVRRVELARDQPRDQAGERRSDLVRAGREPLADEGDDPGGDAGQGWRQLERVDPPEAAAPATSARCAS